MLRLLGLPPFLSLCLFFSFFLSLERRRLKLRLSQSNRHYYYRDITVTVASLRRRYFIRQEYCSIPLRRLISGSQVLPLPSLARSHAAAPYTFNSRETILYADYCDQARRKSNYCRRIDAAPIIRASRHPAIPLFIHDAKRNISP